MTSSGARSARVKRLVMLAMALAVLLPSLYGFGTKFIEFVALYRGDVEGAFAISPILNYLLASLGFLSLFAWAALGGMFRDVERPKHVMLENEARLDGRAPWGDDPPLFGDETTDRYSASGRVSNPGPPLHDRFRNLHGHD